MNKVIPTIMAQFSVKNNRPFKEPVELSVE